MKTVLLNQITKRYYKSPAQWVRNAHEARAFEHRTEADEFCRLNEFQNVRSVILPMLGVRAILLLMLLVLLSIAIRSWMR